MKVSANGNLKGVKELVDIQEENVVSVLAQCERRAVVNPY